MTHRPIHPRHDPRKEPQTLAVVAAERVAITSLAKATRRPRRFAVCGAARYKKVALLYFQFIKRRERCLFV